MYQLLLIFYKNSLLMFIIQTNLLHEIVMTIQKKHRFMTKPIHSKFIIKSKVVKYDNHTFQFQGPLVLKPFIYMLNFFWCFNLKKLRHKKNRYVHNLIFLLIFLINFYIDWIYIKINLPKPICLIFFRSIEERSNFSLSEFALNNGLFKPIAINFFLAEYDNYKRIFYEELENEY